MAEKSIELDSVEIAAAVFGNCDRNIRMLEKEFSVTAVCRGTMLRISGEPANVAAAARAVEGMLLLIENHTPLEDQTVRYCLSLAHDGEEKRVRELTEDFVTVTVKGRPIRPKTLGQKEYLNSIRNNAITFGVGPAGTGKTYLAVAMAVKAFKAKDVSRIVLTRPAVEAGEKLGFLPGDLQQKVDPYLRPLYDGLFDMLGAETYERLVEKQIIEVAPLAYMRGRTLDDSFIILDEAQNTTPEQMKMFLTRMGVGSKVVVTGDVTQIDLPDRTRSGLVDALQVLKGVNGIAQCYFTEKDVVRHRLVQEIIKAYEELEKKLSDPAVASDIKEFTRLNKEYAHQSDLIAASREYIGALDDIEAAKEMLSYASNRLYAQKVTGENRNNIPDAKETWNPLINPATTIYQKLVKIFLGLMVILFMMSYQILK